MVIIICSLTLGTGNTTLTQFFHLVVPAEYGSLRLTKRGSLYLISGLLLKRAFRLGPPPQYHQPLSGPRMMIPTSI